MEGHASISSDVLASYAADAAREVAGVTGVVESPLHRHRGVRVASDDGAVSVELHLAVEWGVSVPEVGAPCRLGVRVPVTHGGRRAGRGRRRRRRGRRATGSLIAMTTRVIGLTRGTDRARPVGLPHVRLVAVAREQGGVQGALDGARRGRVRRVGDDLPRRRRPRARIDAVRAGPSLPARGRSAGRPPVRRRRPRHLLLPRGRRGGVGGEVPAARGDRRGP